MKILLVNTTSNSVMSFRRPLITMLVALGHEVYIIANDSTRKQEIENLGAAFIEIVSDNRSVNVFSMFRYFNKLKQQMRRINPSIVFTFQLKPNIFGVIAAKKCKIKHICAMVEGVGDVFINKGFNWFIIRIFTLILYKVSLRKCKMVYFLNKDNRNSFVNKRLVKREKTAIIDGVGVDLTRFPFRQLENFDTFIMVSRLLINKGIIEYCEAAEKIHNQGFKYKFFLIGEESQLKINNISKYIESGTIVYIPYTTKIQEYLCKATVFVLPSYSEGLPMSTMEAMSTGRAIITTDEPGCRETVIDNYNGLLIKSRNSEDLAAKMREIMTDKKRLINFSKNSRLLAESRFDSTKINEQLVKSILE